MSGFNQISRYVTKWDVAEMERSGKNHFHFKDQKKSFDNRYCANGLMWAKYVKFYYPEKIVSLEKIPPNIEESFLQPKTNMLLVWREQFLSNSKGEY